MRDDRRIDHERQEMMPRPIPVVDLFAGPGGLGESFSSLTDSLGSRIFDVRVSIEKDPVAHRTLSLRALFRSFPKGRAPDCYYDYARGDVHILKERYGIA